MVNLGDGFSIDGVRVPSQLINLLIDVVLDLAHEIRRLDSARTNLLSDVKVASTGRILSLELPKGDSFIGLRHRHVFFLHGLAQFRTV